MSEISGNPGTEGMPEATADFEGNISSPIVTLMAEGEELWTMADMEAAEPCDIIEVDEDALARMTSEGGGVTTALVLADFVEWNPQSPYIPGFWRNRVHDALELGPHGNLRCGTQNHLRSGSF